MEIDGLFRTFSITHYTEIPHSGFLKAAINTVFTT